MIAVVNQFRSPWILKKGNTGLMFSKKRNYTDSRGDERRSYIQIGVEDTLVDKDASLGMRLENMINNSEPVLLSDTEVTLNFDRKTLKPTIQVVRKSKTITKRMLLVSLNIKDSTVVEIQGKQTFLLEGVELPGYVTCVVSFNGDDSEFAITTYDRKRSNLDTHIFMIENGNFIYDMVRSENVENTFVKPYRIKKFRPSRVTEGILVSKDDQKQLESLEFFAQNPNGYAVYSIDQDVEDAMNRMANDGYEAISLYVPDEKDRNEPYSNIIEIAKRRFRILYLFNNAGKVTKVKIK